jgi:uncharacterized membrane protein YdjX (TVP38/TMEM64 family)
MRIDKKSLTEVFSITAIIVFFIVISYLSEKFVQQVSMAKAPIFAFFYFILVILEVILGFVSVIPLIPLAISLWGPIVTFILTWIGWITGSAIIFYISRKFGIKLVKRFISLKKVYKYEDMLPEKSSFFSIVIVRLLIPIDILSYAISIFTKVRFKTYIVATAIGFFPWVILLMYLGNMSFKIQLTIFSVGVGIILVAYLFYILNKFLFGLGNQKRR